MAVLRGRICPVESLIAETASTIFRIMSRGLYSKQLREFISELYRPNVTSTLHEAGIHVYIFS